MPTGIYQRPSVESRFFAKVQKTESCWVWTAVKSREGYGRFKPDQGGKFWMAHRWLFVRERGPVPVDLQLDHLCRNRSCVNPDHLEPVTPKENARRSPFVLSTINELKTHCLRGHEFTSENIYWAHGRWRQCRTCVQIRAAKHLAKRRAA